MLLTEDEKADFLERMQSLLDIDVITKEVRDQIFGTCIMACARALHDSANNEEG